MINIGCHLSSSGGFLAMGKHATELGADTFAFFTRNPRGGSAKEIDPEDAKALVQYMKDNGFGRLVAHAPYTMNVCAEKENIRKFSWEMLADDLDRMQYVPGNYYNFHPGSHVGQGTEAAITMIADALNSALKPEHDTIVLLETMAGKGTEVGRTFDELAEIISRVELKEKVGVCFDTCHTWDGGYDNVGSLDDVLAEFDKVIGLDLGADDYLAKPFGMMEMVSRVKAVLRRSNRLHNSQVLTYKGIELNETSHQTYVDGVTVELTMKEFELLRLFMKNPGQAFTRENLLSSIWENEYQGETRTVDVHIASLRTKLGSAGDSIKTIRGVGYRLEEIK